MAVPESIWFDKSLDLTMNSTDYHLESYDEINQTLSLDFKYCGGVGFFDFHEWFKEFHGYFSVLVCIFGIITNILNIIVLTRKSMVSPTNTILTGLAVADMLVMMDYLPYTIHMYIRSDQPPQEMYTYHWSVFILFHAHFTVAFHTISIALTVCLAVWRFIAVSMPQRNREWCSMERARIAIISSYVFSILFCIPAYLVFFIKEVYGGDTNTTLYLIDFSDIANEYGLVNINFWIYSVFVKLVPCVALTILSLSLIRALYQANQRKIKLIPGGDRSCDRTTRMLLAVLLLFLITEFPQGILALLSGIIGQDFFQGCYQKFGEMMDILALINSAINFILYCTMSRQFRQTFNELFRPRILSKWIAVPQDPQTQATTCV